MLRGDHRRGLCQRPRHAFGAQVGAGAILAAAGGGGSGEARGSGDLALLSAASSCFALGAATVEHFKHLTAACAGRLAGLAVHVAVIAAWGVLSRRDPVLDAPAR